MEIVDLEDIDTQKDLALKNAVQEANNEINKVNNE